jgi:hypothetical protein
MSGEDVIKVLSDIAAAHSTAYWIVGALTLVAFLIMRMLLPVKSLSIVFAPAVFWGGLAGLYAASTWGFVAAPDHHANIVATSMLGMLVALLVMMLLTRTVYAMTRVRKPVGSPASRPARV